MASWSLRLMAEDKEVMKKVAEFPAQRPEERPVVGDRGPEASQPTNRQPEVAFASGLQSLRGPQFRSGKIIL